MDGDKTLTLGLINGARAPLVADDVRLIEALAGSPYFATPETVSNIAIDDPSDLYLVLARTIEREIVPRLILNTRQKIEARESAPLGAPDCMTRSVSSFCQIILTRELGEAETYIARQIAAGADHSRLLIDLFAPTARRLGELWESDECSFVDVTIALGKLHHLLRRFSEAYRRAPEPEKRGFCALLSNVPDSQHLFGLLIVEELFRRSGWTVLALPAPSRLEVLDAVAQEWFAVVGLSISCDKSAEATMSLIAEIRAASLNSSVIVLIGGRYVTANPEQSCLLGADLAGADARHAIERSQELLSRIGR